MEIQYTPRFLKSYQKLPDNIKALVVSKEAIFRDDLHHPALRTHKLKGKFDGFWSFSVNYKYRITFRYFSKNCVILHSIGGHEVYD